MRDWLRQRTLFQRSALVLLALAVGSITAEYLSRSTVNSGLLWLALLLCGIAFRKELLWRVRDRLLVTSFLSGVVPIILIAFLLIIASELLLTQFAAERVQHALQARIDSVRSTARSLAVAASHGAKQDLLDGIRQGVPELGAVVEANGRALRFPASGALENTPAWMAADFSNLFAVGGKYYIGAKVREGNAEAFAYLLLDQQTLESLTAGAVAVAGVLSGDDRTDVEFGPAGSRVTVVEKGVRKDIRAAGLAKPRGWWDVQIADILPWKVQAKSGETEIVLMLISRPSLLTSGLMSGQMGSVAVSVLLAIAGFLFVVEIIAVVSSSTLMRTVTHSADDLYRGTLAVAKGDLSYQIPVRGAHQLSSLAKSFNGMTARIQGLIGEVKNKEKLEAELEIARGVQLRLFPEAVPKLKTLQMAAVCIPGRVVSGDYYDYVRLDDRWTAIALGDVSGKGVSAALLMASIQSALHAQLKFRGDSDYSGLSTAKLMELISQQLYESTPPEKYATFFVSMYDDETGRLRYTNAGHLQPILVRDGKAVSLEGGGMVAGLLPNVKYEEQEVSLQAGDLVAAFSDGIPEAENAEEQEFGEARLAEMLVREGELPLEEIIGVVSGEVKKWIYNPDGRDDLTLLVMRKM